MGIFDYRIFSMRWLKELYKIKYNTLDCGLNSNKILIACTHFSHKNIVPLLL